MGLNKHMLCLFYSLCQFYGRQCFGFATIKCYCLSSYPLLFVFFQIKFSVTFSFLPTFLLFHLLKISFNPLFCFQVLEGNPAGKFLQTIHIIELTGSHKIQEDWANVLLILHTGHCLFHTKILIWGQCFCFLELSISGRGNSLDSPNLYIAL